MARTETFGVMNSGGLLRLDAQPQKRLMEIANAELARRGHSNIVIDDVSVEGAQMTVTFHEKKNLELMEESLGNEEDTAQVEVRRRRTKL